MKHVMCEPWRPDPTPGWYHRQVRGRHEHTQRGRYVPDRVSIVVRYKERYGRDLWVTWLRGRAQDYARAAAKTGVFQAPRPPP